MPNFDPRMMGMPPRQRMPAVPRRPPSSAANPYQGGLPMLPGMQGLPGIGGGQGDLLGGNVYGGALGGPPPITPAGPVGTMPTGIPGSLSGDMLDRGQYTPGSFAGVGGALGLPPVADNFDAQGNPVAMGMPKAPKPPTGSNPFGPNIGPTFAKPVVPGSGWRPRFGGA